MKHNSEKWLLKVEGLTKIYGTANANSIEKTGPLFDSNICPETNAIVACADINF
jgi:putative phosphonate transport system ATP-binding protein